MLVEQISRELGLSAELITAISRNASYRYRVYKIPKRSGHGHREIAHPSKELKLVQRWLSLRLFSLLPVHDAVFSYKEHRSIRDHATRHRFSNFLLRLDFKDFFPSILKKDVIQLLAENRTRLPKDLSDEDFDLAATFASRHGKLTIGAPSSPPLSNAVLYCFDAYWSQYAVNNQITYSRYADDLYFSTNQPNLLEAIPARVNQSLHALPLPRLALNHEKTVFTSRKRLRAVTGLVLTSTNQISLGRDKKRHIRSLVHKYTCGSLDPKGTSYLRGYLAYANGMEPNFVDSLRKKFGQDVIQAVLAAPLIKLKS